MILVTGAAGFIGRNLLLRLAADGERIVAVDRQPQDAFEPLPQDVCAVESCDIFQPGVMDRLLERHRPAVVIALADALAGDPATLVGTGATLLSATLQAARTHGVKRVCIASSLAVYLGLDGPFHEDMPLPISSRLHIAALKKAEEIIGIWFGEHSAVEFVAMRFANIYGPRYHSMMNTPSRYLYEALGRPLDPGKPPLDPTIYAALADFCYIDDLCHGVSLLARAPSLRHRIYNIGGGVGVTDAEVRQAAHKAVGRNDLKGAHQGSPNHLQISRIAEELGYQPRHSISEGMLAYRNWLSGSA